jgi:DNA-binding MurR/RpiR family transcriptional regulator
MRCIIYDVQPPRTPRGDEGPKPRRLSELLEERFDTFSRSQKAIARYIVDHLEETGYLSAEELARKGNTSSSTVVRFAQSLGFSGYPDLQRAARDEHRLKVPARPVVHEDQLLFLVEEDFLTRALRTDVLSLEETLAKNELDAFNRSVDLLAGAGRLVAVGLDEASVLAMHAAYLFELLGIPSWSVTRPSEAAIARLEQVGPTDAVLAVGFRRAHPFTVGFLNQAGSQGVPTLALTDNSLSEIAGKASVTLYGDIDSTFFAHSLVGPLGVLGALGAALYARDRERHDARMKVVRGRLSDWVSSG